MRDALDNGNLHQDGIAAFSSFTCRLGPPSSVVAFIVQQFCSILLFANLIRNAYSLLESEQKDILHSVQCVSPRWVGNCAGNK